MSLVKETENMYINEYILEYVNLANIIYEHDTGMYSDIFGESYYLVEAGSRVKASEVVDKVKTVDKKVSGKMDASYDKILKDLRKKIVGQSREEIINNRTKLSTMVKKAILVGGGFLLNPILGLIALYTQIVIRKGLKEREKSRILSEIKGELEIIEEKLKDADSNNDRTKKYELMRLRRELKKQEEKIRYARFIKD